MKTWEMIKELSSNPNLKFKRDYSGSIFFLSECGNLVIERGGVYIISPNEDWELVREPVDFMTAVKAFLNGKKITCQEGKSLGDRDRTYDPNNVIYEHCLIDTRNEPVSSREILNGKWYIED